MRQLFFLLTLLTLPAFAAKGPFEGKWVLDKSATSDLQGGPEFREVQIKQDGDKIVIRSKYIEPKTGIYPLLWLGVMAYEVKLNADGSATENLFGPYKHQSKTVVEGNKMTTEFQAANETGEAVSGQWIRTVSDDGRQLTCEIRSKAADGRTLEKTLVFKRK